MGWAVLARWTAAGEQAGAPGRRAAPARPQIQLQIQRSMRRRRQEPRPQFGKEVARGSLAWASVAGALRGNGRGSASSGGPFVVRWPLRRQVAPSRRGMAGASRRPQRHPEAAAGRRLPRGGCREAVAEGRSPGGVRRCVGRGRRSHGRYDGRHPRGRVDERRFSVVEPPARADRRFVDKNPRFVEAAGVCPPLRPVGRRRAGIGRRDSGKVASPSYC